MEKKEYDLEQKVVDLSRKLEDVKLENIKMLRVLEEYEIVDYKKDVTDTEAICLLQIKMLLETAKAREFLPDEVKNLESLHKTLKSARGEDYGKKKKKAKKIDKEELLKIVNK